PPDLPPRDARRSIRAARPCASQPVPHQLFFAGCSFPKAAHRLGTSPPGRPVVLVVGGPRRPRMPSAWFVVGVSERRAGGGRGRLGQRSGRPLVGGVRRGRGRSGRSGRRRAEIGRASCRERGWIEGGAGQYNVVNSIRREIG